MTLADGAKKRIQVECPKNVSLDNGWVVNFPDGFGAPPSITMDQLMDLSKSDDAGVKYFSGTASYVKTIALGPEQTSDGLLVTLNLGEVGDGAEVIVNGQNVCTLWAYPFAVDITSYVKTGQNRIEINVSNALHNRFVGDAGLPPEKRITQPFSDSTPPFSNTKPFEHDTPLRPSGLIGPVRLEFNRMVDIN